VAGKDFTSVHLQGVDSTLSASADACIRLSCPETSPFAAPHVGGCKGLNPGLLRLFNWQSDALSTRVDLIHKSEAIISNVSKEVNEI
jgi:hypothetical protein